MGHYGIYQENKDITTIDDILNAPTIALDVESSGVRVNSDTAYGYSISCRTDCSYFSSIHDSLFADKIRDDTVAKIAHNAKYERSMLKRHGISADNWIDTMVAAHLLEYSPLNLEDLMMSIFGQQIPTYKKLPRPLETLTYQEMADNLGMHASLTGKLWLILKERMKRLGLDKPFFNIEMPVLPVVSDIELNGVGVSASRLTELGDSFDKKLKLLEHALDVTSGTTGYNHNSPKQAADIIYNKLGLPKSHFDKDNPNPSVDKRHLETIKDKHPYLGFYLYYKQLKTLKTSYTDSLLKKIEDGRVYGSLNQTRTGTGRFSFSNPNLQKIPKRSDLGKLIRSAFIAPPGHKLIRVDYKLIELVIMAYWSQDAALLNAFRQYLDVHTETAIRAYGDAKYRSKGKTLNYQVIFGGGIEKDRQAFFSGYPGVKIWLDKIDFFLRDNGYARTHGGRIRTIEELESRQTEKIKEHGVRMGVSTMVQGTAAEQVKKGMTRAYQQFKGSEILPVLQVHDEMVYQVPDKYVNDAIDVIWKTFPSMELDVPLTVDVGVGQNWQKLTDIKEGEKYVLAG